MSLLLGFNAVFSTGVQGPASTVGNLYFASWLAFLLCVRICLGCVEEFHNLDDNDHRNDGDNTAETLHKNDSKQEQDTDGEDEKQPTANVAPIEKDRVKRLRSYFFLSIFSMVCGASAYDAASNQRQALSRIQLYLMFAPCLVAAISGILFGLCLSKTCYGVVSRFCFGGILSMVCFGLWLG